MGAVTKTVVGIFMMFMFLWGLFMSLAAAGVHNGYSLICLAVDDCPKLTHLRQ